MFNVLNRQGIQALDINQVVTLAKGWGVVEGFDISIDVGLDVIVSPGSVFIDGSLIEVSESQVITLNDAHPDYPRRDVIFLNSQGDVGVSTGNPEALLPPGVDRFYGFQPSPSSMFGTYVVVIAEVYVSAGQTELQTDDIRDRRLFVGPSSGSSNGLVGQTEEFDNGDSGTNKEIDWSNGRSQKLTLTDDCTLTFINPGFVGRYDIRIIQDGGGGHNITFPQNVIFPEVEPEWNDGVAGNEIIVSVRYDGQKYVAADSGYYEVE